MKDGRHPVTFSLAQLWPQMSKMRDDAHLARWVTRLMLDGVVEDVQLALAPFAGLIATRNQQQSGTISLSWQMRRTSA